MSTESQDRELKHYRLKWRNGFSLKSHLVPVHRYSLYKTLLFILRKHFTVKSTPVVFDVGDKHI